MKYYLVILLSVFLLNGVQAQSVAEYVAFQKAKLTTYSQAVSLHKETKKPVLVWVNCEDFKAWKDLGDEYIHCFVDKFDFTQRGIVLGDTKDGSFIKVKVVEVENVVPKIKDCSCKNCSCDPCKCNVQPQPFQFQPVQVYPAQNTVCYGSR